MAYRFEDNTISPGVNSFEAGRNPLAALLPLLIGDKGSDPNAANPLADALAVLLNAAMQCEREKHLGVAPYERNSERNGQANGYKERTLSTRLGELVVSVPQVRGSNENYRGNDDDLKLCSPSARKQ